MILRKISLFVLSVLLIVLTVTVHLVFIIAVFFLLILLFNWTDFLYSEDAKYSKNPLSPLMEEDAGPIALDRSSNKAVIFVHGFPSTPKTYKYVAPIVFDAGYDVFAPLLPGFGTNHDDFIKSNFSQWYAYLSDFFQEKRKKYDRLYIIGLSMGGALTLKLAEEYSGTEWAPDGISVNAAPVTLRFHRKGVARGVSILLIRTLGWFFDHQGSKNNKWKNMEDGHSEWIGYHGAFPKQIYSLKMGVWEIRKNLSKITVPVIAFQAPEDSTVDFANLALIEKGISSEVKSFNQLDYTGFYNTSHALFLYKSIREKLIRDILDFFEGLEC